MTKKFTKLMAALALLVFMMPSLVAWGQTTYSLQQVTSVETGGLYVFEQDGHVMNNTVASNALQTTDTYNNSGLLGTETYVWTLETTDYDGFFYMKNVSLSNNQYLNNTGTSSTNVGLGTKASIWAFDFQTDQTVLIKNYTNQRFLGYTNSTSYAYKAYASTNLNSYPHAIKVYKLVAGSTPTTYTVNLTQTTGGNISASPTTAAAGETITLTASPADGYSFGSWSIEPSTVTITDNQFTMPASNVTVTAQWQPNVDNLFYESFNNCNGTGGNDDQWSGTIASSPLIADNEGWTFTNGSGANECAKFGTSSKLGSAQTPSISYTGNVTLTFKAAAWNVGSESTNLKLSATSGTLSASSVTLVKGAWTNYTIEITNITNSTQIKFEGNAASNSRFFLDEVMVVEAAPSTDPYITAEDVEITYDAEEGTIVYTINNPVNGGSITASCDAQWIEVDDEPQTTAEGTIDFICAPNSNFYAHSATVTLTYTYGDSKATVTKDITVTQALWPDANGSTAEYPIVVSEAIEAIDEVGTVSNIYVGGIVSGIVDEYSSQYHNITFDMIDEEGNEYYLRAYRCGGDEAANVTVGDEVIVYGNLTKYGEIYEFAQGCEVVSLIHPVVPAITIDPSTVDATAAETNGTLYATYTEIASELGVEIHWFDAAGQRVQNGYDWVDADLDDNWNIYYMIEANDGEARTAYFKVYGIDEESNDVYSNLVTINQAAPVAPVTGEYVKVTSAADLTSGQYLIVYEEGSVAFDGSLETLDAVNNTIEVVLNNGTIAVNNTTVASEFTIDMIAGTIKSASGYYIGRTAASNGMNSSLSTAYINTISIVDNNAVITSSGGPTLRYNSASDQKRFRYFGSGQKAIQLYKKVEPTPAGNTITVNGYGNTDGGYVLLAWPESTSPADIDGMISDDWGTNVTPETSNYDLYSYDGSQEKEWRNYRKSNFNLVPGKGYLYASKAGVTLTYEGEANPEFVNVDLPYVADNKIQSLYLAGNSKTTAETFYVYDGSLEKQTVNILTINGTGDGFTTTTTNSFPAQALQGFFVQSGGQNWTLSTADMDAKSGTPELLNVMVSQNRGGLVDNAIVSFGNAPLMSKFYLTDNSTRIFIPQNGEEMAVVRSEAQGEMPVNFKAKENGTYTLSIDAENVEMNYLHLIDNMTGMDVDLLQTPSYTFEANTNDYANRFKLVFATNGANEADEASFAFFSDGNLIVNNEGNATLQVIDINGRILSSETISGSCSKAINATTGVYMLRLINGDNVKVQKVVVR